MFFIWCCQLKALMVYVRAFRYIFFCHALRNALQKKGCRCNPAANQRKCSNEQTVQCLVLSQKVCIKEEVKISTNDKRC